MTAPKTSGIAAAIGERKTSRRTIRRIGRAISSPRSAGGDRLVLDRPREASRSRSGSRGPAGGSSLRAPGSSSSTVSLTASARSTWKSAMIRAWRGLGRSGPTAPRSQGESVVTVGSGRAARGPAPAPGGRSPAARAAQQDRERGRVAEVLAQDVVGAARTRCRGCRARSG